MSTIKESLHQLLVDPRIYTSQVPLPDPRQLKIYDTTLRDGEQTPGVALSSEQKYQVAREISNLGCHIIDLCFPVVSESEHQLLELVAKGRLKREIRADLEIVVMCRAAARDIDATLAILDKAGFSPGEITFLLFSSMSDLHVKYKLGPMLMSREGFNPRDLVEVPLPVLRAANQRMVVEAIDYARQRGVQRIEFGGEDASRTPVELIIDLTRAAVDAGAIRYLFADTTGSLTPESTRFYCRALTAAFPDIERVSHFHDDFGLAAANTIAGVLNGFTTFTTTVNGIGERAGNAPLHSIVGALKFLYGLEIPDFRYDRLQIAKELVENATGIPVQAKEPLIGRNVFTHESGIHTHGIDVLRAMYEPMPYEEVGGTARFLYGKHSGTANLAALLRSRQGEIGREIDSAFTLEVLDEIKLLREAMISESETRKFIAQYYDNLNHLGFTEDQVVAMARELARQKEAACQLTAA